MNAEAEKRGLIPIEHVCSGGSSRGRYAVRYVPDDFLCPGDNGYGDYIILKVGADGQIEKWRTPAVEMVYECDEDAQHGWKKSPNAELKGGASAPSALSAVLGAGD